jgi:chitooligosaccharide deacetylase
MVLLLVLGFAVVALAHVAPAPFILDVMAGDTAIWHMPRTDPPTVYLTFDDGPNPSTTPQLLDVLSREGAVATFFLIGEHITDETAPIVQRITADGHAIGLHSGTRAHMLMSPDMLKEKLTVDAQRIERAGGHAPCRMFRPHAGWRGGQLLTGLAQMDHRLVGWGWMLWDFNWLRPRTANSTVGRIAKRASAGDIVVMHDGDESAPRRPQPHTVEATARLIPALRARGLSFGTICP